MGLFGLSWGKSNAKTILIVDDELSVIVMVRDILEAQGYTILEADSGVAAIELARKKHPELILLDVLMPNLSGLETLSILKGEPGTKDIPVVMVTSQQLGKDLDAAFSRGAAGYVIKPFQVSQLLEKVEQFVPSTNKK